MNNATATFKTYPPAEERINIYSHASGIFFSTIALLLLFMRAIEYGNGWHIFSFTVFGLSLIALYTASTLYHHATEHLKRNQLRIFDHAAIYLLIAGTYTPFTLVTLHGTTGWILFSITWLMAFTGITLKIFYTGRYRLISTLMYVFMGWLILFAIDPLINSLSGDGLSWLISGGLAYTLGAVLYAIKSLKFNHAIFHLFVMVGSFCHFMSIYFYVLPV